VPLTPTELVEADVYALPFADDSFDGVLSVNTVYFWRDLPADLTEIRRVMAPGGRLVLGIRDPSIMRRLDPAVFTLRDPGAVADAVGAAGFTGAHLDSSPDRRVHFATGTA
jgi:arsenite methyltransferase